LITNMRNIQHVWVKIKGLGADAIDEWGLIAIVFLVAIASYGLGRLSALEDSKPLVSITQAPVAATPRAIAPGGPFVASRGGGAYYYPWCAGGAQITPVHQGGVV